MPGFCRTIAGLSLIIPLIANAGAQGQTTAPGQSTTAPAKPPERKVDPLRIDRIAEIIATYIDKTHGGDAFRNHTALQCDLALQAGDTKWNARLTVQINGRGTRMEVKDGTTIVSDGKSTWIAPAKAADSLPPGTATARLQAWRQMIAAPFAGGDHSVRCTSYRATMVAGRDADACKMTWTAIAAARPAAGPPPTMLVYADARTHRIAALGGPDLPALLGLAGGAAANARAVVFGDFETVENVILPTTWTLYDWSEAAGPKGETIGSVKVSGIRFLRGDEADFARPTDAREDQVPAAQSAPTTAATRPQ